MKKILSLFLLLPLLANAQLKEFEVSEMERPDVAIVQANAQFPDDALLLVYSSLDGLQFRSSMGAVDKQTYNNTAGRYEILVKPVKQMMFVAKPGFMEQKIETFNPNAKDVFYYRAEEKQQEVVNTKPGTLKIVTEPSGADIQLNGIPVSTKTPFEGELNPGSTRIKLQKTKHETIDTTVVIKGGEPMALNVQMKSTTRESSELPTKIGQLYGGGIVFDLTEDGHGLIVALDDLGELTREAGKGKCDSYDGGGFKDWYLPSLYELRKIHRALRDVNGSLVKEGGTAFTTKTNSIYWSSTEGNANYAWGFLFGLGDANVIDKVNIHFVRAVRAF